VAEAHQTVATLSRPLVIGSRRLISRAAGAAAILVGCSVLVGWVLDIGALKSVLPGVVTMKANTALGFVLSGLSLCILSSEQADQRWRRIGQGCAVIVALIGLLTFSEYLFGWDLGIDQLLINERLGAVGTSQPGRMAPTTALDFLMIGLALLLLTARRGVGAVQLLILAAGFIGLLNLIGYAYGVSSLYGVASYTRMAVHTAVTFMALSVGILFVRLDDGLMATVASDSVGGVVARRLLPAAIVVPFLLGWLRLIGQREGLYDTEFGTAIFALSMGTVLAFLIWWSARSLNRIDAERTRAEEERERFFKLSLDMLCIAGFDGYFKRLNPAWERTVGFTTEDLLAKPYLEFVHPDDREATIAEAGKLSTEGLNTIAFENRYLCRDGSFKWLLWNATPLAEQQLIYAVARDITERKRAEEALARQAEELARSNAELEDFTYVVSHDLKEPLRGIEAFSMFLAEDYADKLDEQGERYVNVLREAAIRMRDLIEDLLQLSRIGQVRPEYATVAVESLLEDVRRDLHFALTEKGMDLRIQSDLPTVTCDPSRIKQVFENLISNAIKFSDKPQPVIEITCHENDGSCVFSVRDNGIGIDEKYHEKIFGIFQRLGRREEYEGTGIGLTICKKIVEGHGGKIWVESKVGESTKFSFSIPKETQRIGQGKETQDGRGTDPDSHSPRRGQSSRRRDNGESAGERTSEEPVDSGTRRPGGS